MSLGEGKEGKETAGTYFKALLPPLILVVPNLNVKVVAVRLKET